MSSVDDQVVSMKFDNRNFESNVGKTLTTLAKLKSSLKFDGAAKGLTDIDAKSKGVNFQGMSNGIKSASMAMTALGTAAGVVLGNIATRAISTGTQLAKSLTLKPMMEGFKEYETQMNAVQTILANTAHKGTKLRDVNGALDELNTYADKTIYNFTEMTRNIGTFTAAGIDLKTSTSSIKGIANLAAVSGSNAQQASTAMYQLSQAMAAGKVTLMDWNSVVNAGMGGKVFQDALIRTSNALGTGAEKYIKSEGSFRNSLTKGWITTEVMTKTLEAFTLQAGDHFSKAQIASMKQMGYTEKQIQEAEKLARTATDAATKVKTLTQLRETLSEAMQSGWTKTWQLIIGDFDEAKTLFTGISDALGGIIGRSSDARNNMISAWAKAGGRTMLMQSGVNVFKALLAIMKPIQEAFREIFPPMTYQNLLQITASLQTFTKNLMIGEKTAVDLKNTFKGVFAVFSIAKTLLTSVAKVIFSLFSGAGDSAGGFLEVTGKIGLKIAQLDSALKSGGFAKFIDGIVKGIREFKASIVGLEFPTSFTEFKQALEGIYNILAKGDFTKPIFGQEEDSKFVDFLFKVREGLAKVFEGMKGLSGLYNILFRGDFTGGFWGLEEDSAIVGFLFKIREGFQWVASKVPGILSSIGKKLKEAFSGASINDLGKLAGIGIGTAIGLSIRKAINNISGEGSGLLKSVKGSFNKVGETFGALTTRLKTMQRDVDASIIMKIAVAIGILTLSLVALSLINTQNLIKAVTALGLLMGALVFAMKYLTEFAAGMKGIFAGGKMAAVALAVVAVGAALLMLSISAKILSTVDWNGLAKGVTGVTVLLAALAGFLKIAQFDKSGVRAGLGLVILASSLLIFAVAVRKLGEIDTKVLIKGLAAIAGILLAIGAFTRLNDPSRMIATGIAVTILGASMKLFLSAVEGFGKMSWTELGKGLAGLAGALILVAGAMRLMPWDSLGKAVGLIITAAALKIIGGVITDLSGLSWTEIAKGLIALAGGLAIIAGALYLMSGAIPGALALLVVSPALLSLAATMKVLGGLSWGEIGKGLTTLGLALLILAVGLTLMIVALPGAAALMVTAAALAIFVPVLAALGSMSWAVIAMGLGTLAVALTVLTIAGIQLIPAIPGLLGLSAAILLLGAAIALAGVGVLAFSVGLAALAAAFMANGAIIITAIKQLLTLIPFAFKQLALGIIAFTNQIRAAAPLFYSTLVIALKYLLRAISTVTPMVVSTLVNMVIQFANTLANNVPKLVDAGMKLILGILTGIANNIGQVVTKGADVIVNFLKGIQNNVGRVADEAGKTVVAFVNAAADSIRTNTAALKEAGASLGLAIADGMTGGLASKAVAIGEKAASVAKSAASKAKAALGIASPSKVFFEIGQFVDQGLINGIDSDAKKVEESSRRMATSVFKAADKILSEDLNLNTINGLDINDPVIKPTVDLSNVTASASAISQILSGKTSIPVDGSGIVDPRFALANGEIGQSPRGTNVNMVQNLYSPKALSKMDIYRQTQNQLSSLKGALNP